MTAAHPALEVWSAWWHRLENLNASLGRSRGVVVNSKAVREGAKEAVQFYFRKVRPSVASLDLPPAGIDALDRIAQRILELAGRPNRKSSYQKLLRELSVSRGATETAIEIRAANAVARPAIRLATPTESAILATLDEIVPTAAMSYRQVLSDLNDRNRVSFRGTASEVRQVLRELLDKLAPDEAIRQSGMVLEAGRTSFTMKQRATFILKARGISETARKSPTDAVAAVEGAVGSLARSVYERGSIATHLAATRQEVLTLKGYADAVLADLLQIHKQSN